MSGKRRWLLSEFVVVVIGVLVALAVDDWRQSRADRELERYILQGIRADLDRDLADIRSTVRAAQGRASAADALLKLVGDPNAGTVSGGLAEQLAPHLAEALSLFAAINRFNLDDATYREATASGQLPVLQDPVLRGMIADYYFDAERLGTLADERVEAHALEFRAAAAQVGLSPSGEWSESHIVSALRGRPRQVAELVNVREYALRQISYQARIKRWADSLAAALDAWLAARD